MPRDLWLGLPDGPERDFFAKINDLWGSAGEPAGRSIAAALVARTVRISQGTVNNLITGPRVPVWDNVAVVVRHLGGNPDDFLPLWRAARRAQRRSTSRSAAGEAPRRVGPSIPSFESVAFDLKLLRRGGFTDAIRTAHGGGPLELGTLRQASSAMFGEERLGSDRHALEVLVDGAVKRLADEQSRTVARLLFGLEPGSRGRRLTDRYRMAAEVLRVSERTMRRQIDRVDRELADIIVRLCWEASEGHVDRSISTERLRRSSGPERP